jgi:hypothetical protein
MHRLIGAVVKTVVAISMAVSATIAFSTAANAATGVDGFPILYGATYDLVHHCIEAGAAVNPNTDQETYAIVCADLNTYPDGEKAFADTEVEAFCQVEYADGSAKTVQCANIKIEGEYADGAGDRYTFDGNCGHQYGACTTGRFTAYSPDISVAMEGQSCGTDPDSSSQIWGLALAGTQIELPGSDFTVTLNPNFETGHDYVCYAPN